MPASTAPPPGTRSAQQQQQWAASRAPPPSASAAPPPPPQAPGATRWVPPPPSGGLRADLGRLLATRQGADVDFEVCGRVFAAHKLVLAARSPVFMADFFGPAMEGGSSTSYVRVTDMHPDSFEALLHYIYTDSLPPPETTTTTAGAGGEQAAAAALALAQDLVAAADRYGLRHLKPLAESRLCGHVGVRTALPMLALAERHRCRKLRRKCLEFVAARRNTRAVVATDELEHLARSCPSAVRDVVAEILEAREATPRNPLVVSVDASFYFYALIFVVPFGLYALFTV